jgi:peptidoglycan/LPS O-acetylase OafA/YrhL
MAEVSTVTVEAANVRQTKPHFEVLDGLRGVAAVGVVTFHFHGNGDLELQQVVDWLGMESAKIAIARGNVFDHVLARAPA